MLKSRNSPPVLDILNKKMYYHETVISRIQTENYSLIMEILTE